LAGGWGKGKKTGCVRHGVMFGKKFEAFLWEKKRSMRFHTTFNKGEEDGGERRKVKGNMFSSTTISTLGEESESVAVQSRGGKE